MCTGVFERNSKLKNVMLKIRSNYKKGGRLERKPRKRIAPLLTTNEVYLDLDANTLHVKRQLEKLKCVVHTLPENLSKSTSVLISSISRQTITRSWRQLKPMIK